MPPIPTPYPRHGTQDTPNLPLRFPLRDCHPLWYPVPGDLGLAYEEVPGSTTPHLPYISIRDSVCPLPFSIAFTHGISLISFPLPTKMFHFGRFPFLSECLCAKSHSAIVGSQPPCGFPTHIAAWHDLLRRPNQAIPQTALLTNCRLLGTSPGCV